MSLLILMVLVFAFGNSNVYANTQSVDTIRIGLESRYNNANLVTIQNNSIIIGYSAGVFEPTILISSEGGFTVSVDNSYYLDINERFYDYNSALFRVNELNSDPNNNAVVAFLDSNSFAVYFGGFPNGQAVEDSMETLRAMLHENLSVVPASTNRTILRSSDNNHTIVFAHSTRHPQVVDGNGGFVALGGRTYRGIMEIGRQIGDGITPVNIVDVEEYLYSVVPSEMPAGWAMEALKAQAIAARSYTFSRRGSHARLGYELCDTVFSQVYAGTGNEASTTTEAVRNTRGLKMFNNGNVIEATYFSSSGGVTENSENVWLNAMPYLRSVEDSFETMGMVWERVFTLNEMTAITRANGINIGYVRDVVVSQTAESGRVNELSIIGTAGTHSITREPIRTFFSSANGGSLHSRNFEVTSTVSGGGAINIPDDDGAITQNPEPPIGDTIHIIHSGGIVQVPIMSSFVINSRGEIVHISESDIEMHMNNTQIHTMSAEDVNEIPVGYVTFNGRGWGHGVGMSQFGARGMAEAGFTFIEILQHYYTDVEVRR